MTVVVALSTVLTAFRLPGLGPYWLATDSDLGLHRKVLRSGERRGVRTCLELPLDQHRVADVDDEPGHHEQGSISSAERTRTWPLSSDAWRSMRRRDGGITSRLTRRRAFLLSPSLARVNVSLDEGFGACP